MCIETEGQLGWERSAVDANGCTGTGAAENDDGTGGGAAEDDDARAAARRRHEQRDDQTRRDEKTGWTSVRGRPGGGRGYGGGWHSSKRSRDAETTSSSRLRGFGSYCLCCEAVCAVFCLSSFSLHFWL